MMWSRNYTLSLARRLTRWRASYEGRLAMNGDTIITRSIVRDTRGYGSLPRWLSVRSKDELVR